MALGVSAVLQGVAGDGLIALCFPSLTLVAQSGIALARRNDDPLPSKQRIVSFARQLHPMVPRQFEEWRESKK